MDAETLDGDGGGIARDAERVPDGKGSGVPVEEEKGGVAVRPETPVSDKPTAPVADAPNDATSSPGAPPDSGGLGEALTSVKPLLTPEIIARDFGPDNAKRIAWDMRAFANPPYFDEPCCDYCQKVRAFAARVEALGLEPSEREVVKNQTIRLNEMLTWLKHHRRGSQAMTPPKPSLAERIESEAEIAARPGQNERLRAIAAELREIAGEMRHERKGYYQYALAVFDKWADRLAGREP